MFEARFDSSYGQFPEVYLVQPKSADRVAVKIIEKAQLDWDVKFSENLQREVEIMKNLRHPNGKGYH